MTLYIPYTFVGGTSAKAQEVNANFSQVKGYVEDLATRITSLEATTSQMLLDKADLQGNSNYTFNVATPTNDTNAATKAYVDQQVAILKPIIIGLKATKTGNKSVAVSTGSCFDYLYQNPIINATTYYNYDYPFEASTTYNIYAMARTSNPYAFRFSYSIGNTTPTPPYDDTVFRKIGTLTTDSNAYISTITQETL